MKILNTEISAILKIITYCDGMHTEELHILIDTLKEMSKTARPINYQEFLAANEFYLEVDIPYFIRGLQKYKDMQ
ncbi:MAG: hypothetical protein ACRC0V_05750 [Fusobacteriaceae bacterium]